MKKLELILLGFMMSLPILCSAQNKVDLGIFLGYGEHGSDVHSWGRHGASIFNRAHLQYGLNINYQLSSRFNIRANWFRTNISGDDTELDGPCSDLNDNDVPGPCHKNRGWSFESPLNELGVDIEWHLLKRGKRKENDNFEFTPLTSNSFKKSISPYITAGIAFAFTDPKITFSEGAPPSDALQQQDIQDLSSPYLQFPIGIGLRLDLTRSFSMDFEARGVFPQGDLLDGMSAVTNYEDERNNGDAYQFLSLRLNYHLSSDK